MNANLAEALQNGIAKLVEHGEEDVAASLKSQLWAATKRRKEIEFAATWWGDKLRGAVRKTAFPGLFSESTAVPERQFPEEAILRFQRELELEIVSQWRHWNPEHECEVYTYYDPEGLLCSALRRAGIRLVGKFRLPVNTKILLTSIGVRYWDQSLGSESVLLFPKPADSND